jgi:hypothetical protein
MHNWGGHMKFNINILTTCCILSLLYARLGANTPADSSTESKNYGLQYYFINGVEFAFKFNQNYPAVWRLHFDITGSVVSQESFSDRFDQNDQLTDKNEYLTEGKNFSIEITFEYNYFFQLHKRFQPYVGIGPLLSFTYRTSDYEQKLEIPPTTTRLMERTEGGYGLGAIAVAGIESELVDFCHLFIEYNISYTYNFTRTETKEFYPINELSNTHKGSTHRYQLSLGSVKVGIVLLF